MFGTGLKFKARIKRGASISHDHGYFRWPECKAPGGKFNADDVDMTFEAEDCGTFFSLVAKGYGDPGQYGNGSILLHGIDNLIVADADCERVLARLRADKQKELTDAEQKTAKLRVELESLSSAQS